MMAPHCQFWKQDQISEEQFLLKADTFDILLFRCNTGGAKIIRTYSRSEFDHAAMVLRFGSEPEDVFFIEATGNMGVAIKRYSSMKHSIGRFYQKIVLRHLEWSRPDSALDILEQFLEEAQQCKYDLTLNKLVKKQTVNPKKFTQIDEAASEAQNPNHEEAKVRLIEEGRGFFCSEIVMKAYKVVGLIESNEACSNWLPGDLTQAKNRLSLVKGASLGPELLFITDAMLHNEQEK